MYYSDDVVWHESLFLWGSSHDVFVIATPDCDVYDEFVFRRDDQRAMRVILELPGDVRPTLGARAYRFAGSPSADELRRLIRRGRAIAQESCRKKGVALPSYGTAVSPEGELVPIGAFLEEGPPLPLLSGAGPTTAG